jgi:hypothetical protein
MLRGLLGESGQVEKKVRIVTLARRERPLAASPDGAPTEELSCTKQYELGGCFVRRTHRSEHETPVLLVRANLSGWQFLLEMSLTKAAPDREAITAGQHSIQRRELSRHLILEFRKWRETMAMGGSENYAKLRPIHNGCGNRSPLGGWLNRPMKNRLNRFCGEDSDQIFRNELNDTEV